MVTTCSQCGHELTILQSTGRQICQNCKLVSHSEPQNNSDSTTLNNSGQGKLFDQSATVPQEIKGWCWGAFLLGIFWCIGNQVWLGVFLLTLSFRIPFLGFPFLILLGLKGNEWAWKSRRWKNIEQFKSHQKQWAMAGIFFLIAFFVLGFIYGLFFG